MGDRQVAQRPGTAVEFPAKSREGRNEGRGHGLAFWDDFLLKRPKAPFWG